MTILDFTAPRQPRPIVHDDEFGHGPAGSWRWAQWPFERFSGMLAEVRKPAPARVPTLPWPASRGLGGWFA